MSSKFLKNKEFNSILNKVYNKYKQEILDLVLFGSSIKGKKKPNDLDILILFKEKENLDIAYELRKNLEKFKIEVQVATKTYGKLFDASFRARESFLGEGYSLIRKQFISQGLGYSNMMLFKYELKGFSQTKRMQLQYALYGRDRKSGIVNELKLKKFSNSVFFCNVENAELLKEFFESWNIRVEAFPVLIPERILLYGREVKQNNKF